MNDCPLCENGIIVTVEYSLIGNPPERSGVPCWRCLTARAMKVEQERDALDALVNDLTARVVAAEQENARLSIKLTVSEQDVEHWAASDAAARAQLRSLLDFAERHQLSYADHDHDCYELWCIERDYTRRLIEEAPDA